MKFEFEIEIHPYDVLPDAVARRAWNYWHANVMEAFKRIYTPGKVAEMTYSQLPRLDWVPSRSSE